MKLLITGSRDATEEMLDAVDRILVWVKEVGHEIVIGDAKGVDARVIHGCIERRIPFKCYGITQQPRTGAAKGNYYRVECPDLTEEQLEKRNGRPETVGEWYKRAYLNRDRVMVQICDRCVAIWNGASTGTIYTFSYAFDCDKAKKSDLRIFAEGKPPTNGEETIGNWFTKREIEDEQTT